MIDTFAQSDTTNRRLVIAASCLLAPALLLAAFLVGPSMAYDRSDRSLSEATAHHAASVVQAMLLLASSALFVPVLVGALHLLRERGRTLGRLGAVAFLAGLCGHLMLVAARLVLVQMAGLSTDHEAMINLAHRFSHTVFAVITPLEFAFDAGLVLLFIGLRRASAIPTWILLVIVGVAIAAGLLGSNKAAFVVAGAGGLIAGAYVAVRIAITDNATWASGSLVTARTELDEHRQLASAPR